MKNKRKKKMLKKGKLYFKKFKLYYKDNKNKVWKITNIIFCFMLLVLFVIFITLHPSRFETKSKQQIETAVPVLSNIEIIEEVKAEEKIEELIIEEVKEVKTIEKWNYRLTSYYTGDGTNSGSITASGKKTSDFKINDKGWYTYKGKLVIATASKRLLSWDKYKDSKSRMFNLYDELVLEIDGIEYDAIVLDVCGASMKKDIIDLFVANKQSVKDTQIKVYKK